MLEGKVILQEMCRDNLDWDAPLPDHLLPPWEKWITGLPYLERVEISRCQKPPDFGPVKGVEIHNFSYASSKAYGQCSYLRLINDEQRICVTLLFGKSRVVPLKTVTIPRLELTAALVSIKMIIILNRELDFDIITNVFGTDSKVVLGYLSNDSRRFHVYVANRVQQIRDETAVDEWYYVATEDNPADDTSRGLSARDHAQHSRWFNGPEFLQEAHMLKCEPESYVLSSGDPEVKTISLGTSAYEVPRGFEISRLDICSDWFNAKRAVATCLRLRKSLRDHTHDRTKDRPSRTNQTCTLPYTVTEILEAERQILMHLQRHYFKEEIKILAKASKSTDKISTKRLKKSGSLYKLDPFIDDHGILRVGGRIREGNLPPGQIHPMILPRKSHVTELII